MFVESDFYDGILNVNFPESETLVVQGTFTAPEDGVYRFMAYCNIEDPDFDLYDGEQRQDRFYSTDGEYIFDFAVWLEGEKSYTMKSRNSSSGSSTERVFYKKLNLQLDIPSDGSNESDLTHINPKLATAPHNVTLTGRTLFCDGGWNTLCLPFTLDTFDGTPLEGYTVMELDTETPQDGKLTGYDSSTGTLCLNFKNATSITAGKPYIAKKSITYNENDTPTYTATSGTEGSKTPDQDYDKLVDKGGVGFTWRTDFKGTKIPSYCEFQAPGPVDVTGYVLTTSNQKVVGDPKVWTLKGKCSSRDAWTIIDSRNVGKNSGDALPSGRTADKEYTVQNPGAYRYFRFEVTEVTGVPESGNTFLCLTELTMKGTYVVNVVNPLFSNVVIVNNAPSGVASKDGKVQFKGTYDKISFGEDNKQILFLGGEDKLYYPQANASIGACHAYFQLYGIEVGDPNQVKAMVLNFDGDATGISNPSDYFDLSKYSENWYDLNGRRLTGKPSRKGIYIRNGRKEVLR
ncbi:MAG: hypothetical protein K5945_09730 [Bacteroidaceae bacterium]|nr:hypothetical protein [Bacteroidaceae bacterium]